MVNLLQMVFQLFKGSLTFKNQSIIILEGQFRLFTGVQTGLQWLVIITKKINWQIPGKKKVSGFAQQKYRLTIVQFALKK